MTTFPALAVAFGYWLVLLLAVPAAFVHIDSTRDLLIARDCAELGHCAAAGATTSLANLRQGALWTNLLAATRLAGLSPAVVHHLLLVLHGLAAGAAVGVTRRWQVAPLLLLGSLWVMPPTLWNPVLMFPFAVLGVLAWQQQLPILAGLLLGVAADTHPVAGLLAVSIVGHDVGRGQLRGAAKMALAALLVVAIASPWALVGDVVAVGQRPLLLAGLGLVAIGAGVAGRLLPGPLGLGLWLVLVVALGPLALHHNPALRYAVVALPLLAVALAQWSNQSAGKKLPAAAVAALVLIFAWKPAYNKPDRLFWTYADAEALAGMLTQNGIGWPHALLQVQAVGAQDLVQAAAVWLPDGLQTTNHQALAVADVPTRGQPLSAPPLWTGLPQRWVFPLDSRLDWSAGKFCFQEVCTQVDANRAPQAAGNRFAGRARPEVIALPAGAPQTGPFVLRVPLRPGPYKIARLAPDPLAKTRAWRWCSQVGPDVELAAAATDLALCLRLDAASALRFWRAPNPPIVLELP